jgi:hypothetical protein
MARPFFRSKLLGNDKPESTARRQGKESRHGRKSNAVREPFRALPRIV